MHEFWLPNSFLQISYCWWRKPGEVGGFIYLIVYWIFHFFYIPKISSINSINNLHLQWQPFPKLSLFPVSTFSTSLRPRFNGRQRWHMVPLELNVGLLELQDDRMMPSHTIYFTKRNTMQKNIQYIYNISYTTANKRGVSWNGGTPISHPNMIIFQ